MGVICVRRSRIGGDDVYKQVVGGGWWWGFVRGRWECIGEVKGRRELQRLQASMDVTGLM